MANRCKSLSIPHPAILRPVTAALMTFVGSCVILAPGLTLAQSAAPETTLPEVKVQGQSERADGPVTGYRATRSSTFNKTDTPLKEVPASVTVIPTRSEEHTSELQSQR